jgi:hypothetical protein
VIVIWFSDGDVQNTVSIDVEYDFDLRRNTARRRRDARKLELAEQIVVLDTRKLALEYLDEHTRLFVGLYGKGSALDRIHRVNKLT